MGAAPRDFFGRRLHHEGQSVRASPDRDDTASQGEAFRECRRLKERSHPPTGRVADRWLSAPQRHQFVGMLQAAVETQRQVLEADPAAVPEPTVESDENPEEIEGQH